MQAHLFPPSLPTLSRLAPSSDDHQVVSCLLLHLMVLLDDIEPKHCALILVIRPLSTLPSRFLLLWLPKNWRAEQAGRCGRGLDDKGADTVRELTTRNTSFAMCHRHSAKTKKHSAKALPSVTLGKQHMASTVPTNVSLLSVFYRALGKYFAES